MTQDRPAWTGERWRELLADTTGIAEEYRENGWDAIVLEPDGILPVVSDDRTGFDVAVSREEYDLVETLIEGEDVTITAADVYYRPPEDGSDRRMVLAVERDETTETAVFVPIAYDLTAAGSVFETALEEAELLVHVVPATGDDPDNWVSFSHGDPTLFLEDGDVERVLEDDSR